MDGSCQLAVLVSLSGEVVACSEALRPLLPDVTPLLPDLVHAETENEVLLQGRRYTVTRQPLLNEAGTTFAFLIALQAVSVRRADHRLSEMVIAISSKLDLEHVLEQVVRFAMELLDADAGSLPLYDPERERLTIGHLVNLPVNTLTPIVTQRRGLMWQLIKQRTSLLIADYPNHPVALPELVHLGVRSLLATSIVYGNTPLGILALYRMRDEPFQESDRDILQAIALQTAIALHSTRMYQRAMRNADERYALYQASLEMGATLDLEQLYQAIHRAVSRLVRHSRFMIATLVDQRTAEYVYVYTPDGRQPVQRWPVTHGLAGYVLRFGVSLRLSSVQMLPAPGAQPLPELEGDLAEGSFMATPLIVDDRIIGALVVGSDQRDVYAMSDLSALELLAATVAVALHNAMRFAHIQSLTITDTLTELVNRRHFFQILHHEIERSRRYRTPVSIAMIDLDHFKQVNDTYGHVVGDKLLREVALRCRRYVRDVDILARYGGEEFGLILPETRYESALLAAERLRQHVMSVPFTIDGHLIPMTLSIGVACFQADVHPDPSSLVVDADQALYLAKQRGRNCVCGTKELSRYAES
ncbi:MAG: diguanylate cyclase [Chloroflexus sp.]|uniref:diguanylate cyclase n=1 Tax=Chloroflexus sp. TaxID=1904827 RepID=UPI0021DDA381|nr:diguanylate cyclase [Chloroflexus sp.]GIV90476.1 MAG: diguanylate cyclase [Chloroflexus sp.]